MITVLLTFEQAQLVSTAIQAEIRKGGGTFLGYLTYDDVEALTVVKDAIDSQVEARIARWEMRG
jgi:hypothetical protein